MKNFAAALLFAACFAMVPVNATSAASTCLKNFQPDAAASLDFVLNAARASGPRFSGAVFGTNEDGLMYVAQVIGTNFEHVQVVDLNALSQMPDARSTVFSTVQNQLSTLPNTLFVIKGVESFTSATDTALLDGFHDLMEDGELSLPGGQSLTAPGAGVLLALDTAALKQSESFNKLTQADQARLESQSDLPALLQAVLSAHGGASNGAHVVTPAAFVGRLRSFIALAPLSAPQRVQLAEVRAASKANPCSHAGLVATTTSNQAAFEESEEPVAGAKSDSDALFRRVAEYWMDPHTQNVTIPRAFAIGLGLFLVVFALGPGKMPPKGSFHHPQVVYQNVDALIEEERAHPCDVDVTGEGRWEGPNPQDMNPKRKHADSIAASEAGPPGVLSPDNAGDDSALPAASKGSSAARRRSAGSRSRSRGRSNETS